MVQWKGTCGDKSQDNKVKDKRSGKAGTSKRLKETWKDEGQDKPSGDAG